MNAARGANFDPPQYINLHFERFIEGLLLVHSKVVLTNIPL